MGQALEEAKSFLNQRQYEEAEKVLTATKYNKVPEEFKLVGDMTLKQFFQVAGGALVGLLFYSTGLHGLIKWPLILISTKKHIPKILIS